MVKRSEKKQLLTDDFDLHAELSTVIEKKMLPSRIAEKIGEKITERNISITKEQFYKLVEKIQTAIQPYFPDQQLVPAGECIQDSVIKNTDMKELVHSIERLEERIQNIEEQNIRGVKGVSGKLVRTKDIKTFDKTDVPFDEELEPLFEIPNDPESVVVLMKWLQYLVDKLGKNNLADILGYYVDIDWISDDVRLDLIKYSKGITDEKKDSKKDIASLTSRDHIQSFLFIQKLKGHQFDDRFIWKIDREMEKMAKSIDEYKMK